MKRLYIETDAGKILQHVRDLYRKPTLGYSNSQLWYVLSHVSIPYGYEPPSKYFIWDDDEFLAELSTWTPAAPASIRSVRRSRSRYYGDADA